MSENKIECKKCGEHFRFELFEQTFKNGTKHVKAKCENCGAFFQYLPQVIRQMTDEADANHAGIFTINYFNSSWIVLYGWPLKAKMGRGATIEDADMMARTAPMAPLGPKELNEKISHDYERAVREESITNLSEEQLCDLVRAARRTE